MRKINIGVFILALAIPLIIGAISAALSSRGMAAYGTMSKPPLSPPGWVFSVAWTILYIMMGAASYYVVMAEGPSRLKAVAVTYYGVQLAMNFMWSIIFFRWESYLGAFIWLMALWCIVITCAFRFYAISKMAAYLMIPYVLWLTFAAYLNMGAYVLSRR